MLGLVQCTKDQEDPAVALGEKIELKVQQTGRVATATAPVQLTVTQLLEARCPANVDCVSPGSVDVTVELRDKAGKQQAALCLGECRNDSAAVVLDAVPYWLRLTSVDPYPATNARFAYQTATLYLTRR